MDELNARISQLENNMATILSVRKTEDERNAALSESNKKEINEEKRKNNETNASIEETAITVADFLAEYYLSQLGIDDFDMEGGEGE